MGTANDQYLKTNIDWVSKASNWAKFSIASTLGMMHIHNYSQASIVLEPYLKSEHINTSPYSGGGAFYALGLIHACTNKK